MIYDLNKYKAPLHRWDKPDELLTDIDWLRWFQVVAEKLGDLSAMYPYNIYYYDGSGNIEYICSNAVHGRSTSAADWRITKLAYGADGVTNKQTLTGSVTGRAALGWV